MKWIGQNIENFISRFQQKVYLESADIEIRKVSGQPTLELSAWSATATAAHAGRIKFLKSGTATVDTYTAGNHTTSGEILGRIEAYGIDDGDGETLSSYIEFANDAVSDADSSPGQIIFATSDADDAGTPTRRLTIDDDGLATFTGAISVGGNLTFDSVALTGIQTSAESFVDNDVSVMTSAAIADKIEAYGYSTTAGDITAVVAGTNLTGGATSGSATITLADASTSAKGAASFNSDHFATSSGAVSLGTAMTWADTVITTDSLTFTSANADDPSIEIKNTNTNNQAARLTMRKDPGEAGADSDVVAELEFFSVNDAGTPQAQMYGKIITSIHDATDGQESGDMEIRVATHDGELQEGLKMTGGAAEDEINVTIGGPATSSTTTVSGDLTISGDTLTFNSQIGRRAYFEFKGYGTSDGTNYEMPELMTENKAPFEHDTSTGSDGLTAMATTYIVRSGGIVMPHAGVLKKFTGWVSSAGTGTVDVGIFKFTPVDNDANAVSAVLLKNTQITAAGNTKMRSFSETSFSVTVAAGDVVYSAVLGGTSAKTWYLLSTLEIEWS